MSIQEQDAMIHARKEDTFEGWYVRIQQNHTSLAVIFGISWEKSHPHAFIQTLDTLTQISQNIEFSLMDVHVQRTPFSIRIGHNQLSYEGIRLELEGDVSIYGSVSFHDRVPLPASLYAPTAMGPFAYLPNMECVHSILSMQHHCEGQLQLQEQLWKITSGLGYIEKDRGNAFPQTYLWLQGFDKHGASFVLAIASIPFSILHFQGTLGCLITADEAIRIGSYYGAIPKIKVQGKHIQVVLRQKAMRIYIDVWQKQVHRLKAPCQGAMKAEIEESLNSDMTVRILRPHSTKTYTFLSCACEYCDQLHHDT